MIDQLMKAMEEQRQWIAQAEARVAATEKTIEEQRRWIVQGEERVAAIEKLIDRLRMDPDLEKMLEMVAYGQAVQYTRGQAWSLQ